MQREQRPGPLSSSNASLRTAAIALGSDVVIAVSKLVAGLLTGSVSLIADAVHGTADVLNEVLLIISVRAGRRPPTERHPFGTGAARFLWAFIAAVSLFVLGGSVAVALGVVELISGEAAGDDAAIGFVVLAIAFAADAVSFQQGLRQAHRLARGRGEGTWRLLATTSDPVVRAVVVEDGIGLIGDLVAAGGLTLKTVTGSVIPDAVGAILIGLVLAAAAFVLARILGQLLVGRGLPAEKVAAIRAAILADGSVATVDSISTIVIGPDSVLVTAKVVPAAGIESLELGRRFSAIDQAIRSSVPGVVDVYLDPTDRAVPTTLAVSPALQLESSPDRDQPNTAS